MKTQSLVPFNLKKDLLTVFTFILTHLLLPAQIQNQPDYSICGITNEITGNKSMNYHNNSTNILTTNDVHYTIPIYAIKVSDDNGHNPTLISSNDVRQWTNRANAVYAKAKIQFTFDGELHPLKNTLVNNVEGVDDLNWDSIKRFLNLIATREKKLIVIFRNKGSGGFSWWDYNFVVMPAFSKTKICSRDCVPVKTDKDNLALLAHEFGHYFGLPHTFNLTMDKKIEASLELCNNSNDRNIFDGDKNLISDTDPDPMICDFECITSINSVLLNGQNFNLLRTNPMSYWYYHRPQTFTNDQIQRIRFILELRIARNILLVERLGNSNTDYIIGWNRNDFINENSKKWNLGYRLKSIDTYLEKDGSVRFNAVWQRGIDFYNYVESWQYDDFLTENRKYSNNGWTPYIINSYIAPNGTPRFNVVWKEGDKERTIYMVGTNWENFNNMNKRIYNSGKKIETIDTYYTSDKKLKFNAVWVESYVESNYVIGWKWEDFMKENDKYWNKGWSLDIVDTYLGNDNNVRFNAVWVKGNMNKSFVLGWTRKDFENKNNRLYSAGYYLKQINTYLASDDTPRFNAIWCK